MQHSARRANKLRAIKPLALEKIVDKVQRKFR